MPADAETNATTIGEPGSWNRGLSSVERRPSARQLRDSRRPVPAVLSGLGRQLLPISHSV
jgi:hypothetical protein